ncbi:MAG: sigma-70 family RNA polymerase sigma factor [Alphaproteobacteria bacterium]|nr:sigma-70 family RNA polymerase sigma factor [Alphaproteobacteria bacterium]
MAQKQAGYEKQRAGNPHSSPERSFEDMIVAIAQNNDRPAFIGLFGHFAPRIKSWLIKGGMSPEAADDLAQETMLGVWHKAASFDPRRAGASTWIFTIARNKKIDLLRKGTQYGVDIDALENMESGETPAPETLQRREETSRFAAALETLPPEQADLLRESFFENKSHSEIAQEKNIPIGTVKSRIRLALDRLRKEKNIQELWQ